MDGGGVKSTGIGGGVVRNWEPIVMLSSISFEILVGVESFSRIICSGDGVRGIEMSDIFPFLRQWPRNPRRLCCRKKKNEWSVALDICVMFLSKSKETL